MSVVILSGGIFGGRTVTGDFLTAQDIKASDGVTALRYRIINGQAVYEGTDVSDIEAETPLDPQE